jgi:molecular chaperone DnaK
MPCIQEFVRERYGKPVHIMTDSDLAVAKGAAAIALQCDKNARNMAALDVNDVTAHSLGVLSVSNNGERYVNEIMIKRNTPVPCTATRQFNISRNNNTDKVEIYVLQGESYDPLDCLALSKHVVTGFKNDGDGVVLNFEYSYDENGTVGVKAYHDERELNIATYPVEDVSWMGKAPSEVASFDAPPINIVFCVDLSYSMKKHNALETAKSCIYDFITRLNQQNRNLGLVGFGDKSRMFCELTDNGYNLSNAVRNMKPNMLGVGTSGSPFNDAKLMLKDRNGGRIIILLTDGKLRKRPKAKTDAEECTELGISIFSIGFGEADTDFLDEISNTDTGAIFTEVDKMSEAFGTIATAINNGRYGLRMRN